MAKKILVFNVGSSTIKFSFFENEKRIFKEKYEKLGNEKDYINAFDKIYQKFKNSEIDLILHRVVHAGEMKELIRINKKVKEKIKLFSEFAPLHNEKELLIINLAEKFKKPQYAVFDSSFFADLPEVSKLYPIPLRLIKKYKIRRYGFHGLSHESVSMGLKGKTITVHLGQGASISAIKNGNAIDTSMGLTPLEGVMMCTRSGTVDPGLVVFLNKKGYNAEKILNSESGFKGLTGYSDFRKILKNIKKKEVKLAYEIFVYSIIKYIGAYTAVLNGLDNLVFTGGIGRNSPMLREDICKHLGFLGMRLDSQKNKNNKELISLNSSKVRVYARRANEDEIMVKKVLAS